jgi:flagellar basal-body rod protein FlgF
MYNGTILAPFLVAKLEVPMIKGIYTSATAMRQGILRQEITANNLANASTAGFKRDRLFVQELVAAQEGSGTDPLALKSSHWTDFEPGAYDPTGNSLDLALQGRGFFVVSDGQTECYTRNGHFERTAEGRLVDERGRAVQGEGGNITLPTGVVTVQANGTVSVDDTVIDRLRVVDFENLHSLRKAAGSAFTKSNEADTEAPVENPTIRQGFLESSNVDSVKEMVEMISTARNYEINAKLVTVQDDTLRHSANEIGRV